MTSELRCKVKLYHKVEVINKLGERTKQPDFLKDSYCRILPLSNIEKSTVADTNFNEQSHKFRFRKQSVKGLQKDWIIEYENRTYEIKGWDEDFKNNEFVDIYAVLIQE